MTLFPFTDYWWFYLGFMAFVLVILALDLGVFHKTAHEVGFKEAGYYSFEFSATGNLASGVYYCKLNSGEFEAVKRMILLK